MAVTDDVARVVRELWRLNQLLGWSQRTGMEMDGFVFDDVRGRVAKASGMTREQLDAFMRGEAQPTTGQALAALDAMPLPLLGTAVLAESNGKAG